MKVSMNQLSALLKSVCTMTVLSHFGPTESLLQIHSNRIAFIHLLPIDGEKERADKDRERERADIERERADIERESRHRERK